MLCVQAEEEWSWDASAPLLERKVFELQGSDNSVATKIDQEYNLDNYMITAAASKDTTMLEKSGQAMCSQCRSTQM